MSKRSNSYSSKLIIGMLLMFLTASFSPLVSANNSDNNQQNEEENTKYTEDIQPGQYLGLVLMFIGILPFIRYLIFYFIFNEADNFF